MAEPISVIQNDSATEEINNDGKSHIAIEEQLHEINSNRKVAQVIILVVLLVVLLMAMVLSSCSTNVKSDLQGHYYNVIPLANLQKAKMNMLSLTSTHHYIASDKVEVTGYIAGTPNRTQIMTYSINGSAYTLEDERYDIKNDTGNNFTLLINNVPMWELEYIK